MAHHLTGFGFGPIQAGLFVKEAYESGRFERVVVAEIDRRLVEALRRNGDRYTINVAGVSDVTQIQIEQAELRDPGDPADLALLRQALSASTDIVTALPSVQDYDRRGPSVAALIAEGLNSHAAAGTFLYAAENDCAAAQRLEEAVRRQSREAGRPSRYLNTVIGKMSRVVDDPAEISRLDLAPLVPGFDRAFLVEAFNEIFVTEAALSGCVPGFAGFQAKPDLRPFEEAKLFGHNAVHAVMAYLGHVRGHGRMTDIGQDEVIMSLVNEVFLREIGGALRRKHGHLKDALFSEQGFGAYAEDLIRRMTHPFLADRVERIVRQPLRKLQLNDRLFGTMSLILDQGIQPVVMSMGAVAALHYLLDSDARPPAPKSVQSDSGAPWHRVFIEDLLRCVWRGQGTPHRDAFLSLLERAWPAVERLRS